MDAATTPEPTPEPTAQREARPPRTVRVRTVAGGVAALAALAAAFGLGQATTGSAHADDAATSAAAGGTRTVTMRGTGTAHAVPDEVTFDVSVSALRPELSDALAAANAAMSGATSTLSDHGVPSSDLQTTGLDMQPQYTYRKDMPPLLRGYRVSQQLAVKVTDVGKAGGAISAVVAQGGNRVRVDDIALGVSDPDAHLDQARSDAVAQATSAAQAYASATGQTLGAVRTITEVQPGQVNDLAAGSIAQDSVASAPVPISAGRDDLSVTVQVVWELA